MQLNQRVYNAWAWQYDSNHNRTRDLEAVALRETLDNLRFSSALELGCGTGKNTAWLADRVSHVTAVDFSEAMLAKAREKISAPHVSFHQADITQPWMFTDKTFDLVTFSLVLEHIEDLSAIFGQARQKLGPHGMLYLGELHPFRQYTGTVARFDSEAGRVEAQCFLHHLTDFFDAATGAGFSLRHLREWFDDGDRRAPPRILGLLLEAV